MKHYKDTGKTLSAMELSKMLTQFKKRGEFIWLKTVSAASLKESLRDLGKAYENFFEKQKVGPKYTKATIKWAIRNGIELGIYQLNGYPKFKKKKYSKIKYYCRYDRFYFEEKFLTVEKIGKIKFKNSYNIDLKSIEKFSNPRIEYIGNKWIVSFAIDNYKVNNYNLNNISIGVDLGIKKLVYCSDESLNANNINKSQSVRKLKKKNKRFQRMCSRKYIMNKNGNKFIKTNNIIKLESKLRKIQNRLNNIRTNYLHSVTTRMVKTKPSRIVIEDLDVRAMMANRYLAKSISEQSFNKFRKMLKYKCEDYGIELVIADRWFPSSKSCSGCGHIKKDLKLSDRVYKCPTCNIVIDRDLNAALNLSKYDLIQSM